MFFQTPPFNIIFIFVLLPQKLWLLKDNHVTLVTKINKKSNSAAKYFSLHWCPIKSRFCLPWLSHEKSSHVRRPFWVHRGLTAHMNWTRDYERSSSTKKCPCWILKASTSSLVGDATTRTDWYALHDRSSHTISCNNNILFLSLYDAMIALFELFFRHRKKTFYS